MNDVHVLVTMKLSNEQKVSYTARAQLYYNSTSKMCVQKPRTKNSRPDDGV